jgi:hypothetical protein
MLRYHKQVYFNPQDIESLKAFTNRLNGLIWRYSSHSIDNLRHRAIDLEGLLIFIKDIELKAGDIFEFYADENNQEIIKVCYRINWQKDLDIILVLSQEKNIITVYINSKTDEHFTLRKEAYINE